MVTELTQELIAAGEHLVRRMDETGLRPDAAFWLHDPESGTWSLVLAEMKVKTGGARSFYATLRSELADAPEIGTLTIADITAVPPDHPLVRLLRSALTTGPGISGIRFSNNVINGILVDDAYVYRLR
jgi:hypothetical protein